ncbi:MAG: ankyrin repeat domain-containing protein, partial [Elusimicrobia bacterium]|nr:ankyrin repeat domain-containing protein [Elusimicrobiota bacterium]
QAASDSQSFENELKHIQSVVGQTAVPNPGADRMLVDAVYQGNLVAVKAALSKGADSNTVDFSSRQYRYYRASVLYIATFDGNIEIVKALLAAGADPNFYNPWTFLNVLGLAANEGHVEIVRELIKDPRTNVDAPENFTANWTPLMVAAGSEHKDSAGQIVQMLLDTKRVNIEARSRYEDTPLILAVRKCHLDVSEALIKAGADVNAKARLGISVLDYACAKVLPMLLRHPKIDLNARHGNGGTLLRSCVDLNEVEKIKILLQDPRVDVNAQDKYGYTALHSEWGSLEAFNLVLQQPNINVNLKNSRGQTPLIFVVAHGYTDDIEKIQALLRHPQIDVNAQDNEGRTALIEAADSCHPPTVEVLLADPRVNVNLRDKNGWTALDHITTVPNEYGKKNRCPKIAQTLRNHGAQ